MLPIAGGLAGPTPVARLTASTTPLCPLQAHSAVAHPALSRWEYYVLYCPGPRLCCPILLAATVCVLLFLLSLLWPRCVGGCPRLSASPRPAFCAPEWHSAPATAHQPTVWAEGVLPEQSGPALQHQEYRSWPACL